MSSGIIYVSAVIIMLLVIGCYMISKGCIYGFNYLCFENELYKATLISLKYFDAISGGKIYAYLLLENNDDCYVLMENNITNSTLIDSDIQSYNQYIVGNTYYVAVDVTSGNCWLTKKTYYLSYTIAGLIILSVCFCFLTLILYSYYVERYKRVENNNDVDSDSDTIDLATPVVV